MTAPHKEAACPRETYTFTNGWTMAREDPHPYYWILLDDTGQQQDRDKYRNDLIERHRLTVALHRDPFLFGRTSNEIS